MFGRFTYGSQAVVAILVVVACACSKAPPPVAETIRPVRVIQVQGTGGQQRRSLSGVARAGKEIPLSFRVGGTIVELNVKLGATVKKGDVIAVVDDRDARIEIQAQRAALARAEAQFRAAQADYARTRALFESNSASRAELDAARAAEESGKAAVKAETQALALNQSRAGDHVLKARADGVIAQRPVEVGQNVSAGQMVALLNAGAHAEVEVAVPESLIGSVAVGAKAAVEFDAIGGEPFPGTVSEVGVAPSEAATTFPVKVQLDGEHEGIRSGMAAVVTLEFGKSGEVAKYFLDPRGVTEDSNGRYVMLAVPADEGFATVKRSPVEVVGPSLLGIEVSKGVKEGDLMIVAGLRQLVDGQRVRLLPNDQPKYAQGRIARDLEAGMVPKSGELAAPKPSAPAPSGSAPPAPSASHR